MGIKEIFKKENYPKVLLFLFVILWLIVAIAPRYRSVWIAENIPAVLFIGLLILTYNKFRFSDFSYTLLFLFMILSTIGSYYSYSEVPLFDLIQDKFGLERNHYDRVMHFLFGLIFFFPVYEFIRKKLKIKLSWAFLLTFFVIVALKGIFEVIEWLLVLVTKEDITIVTNYLGMQGDPWDTQKDMLVGMIGSVLSWIWARLRNI